MENEIKKALKQYWGYDDFRQPQAEVITTLLTGKDALIVMPTGMGKSICFQLPALLKTGLTLVISPLVALIENQVLELQKKQLPAALLHSEVSKNERKKTIQLIEENKLRLLYLSPETFLSPNIWSIISQPKIAINGLILDEAHCLAQWGETFRPAYRRLGIARQTLVKLKSEKVNIAIAAFTATADKETQKIIIDSLKLNNPQKFLLNPYRKNLHINIKIHWTPKGKKKQLKDFINKHKNQSGLIYVRSRKDSQLLSSFLAELGYQNKSYHAGLSAVQRRKIEQAWLNENIKFVVCTNAFGMGINKENIRWVCHYQPPTLLSEYIQEIGRGGRDGKTSEILTLISEPTGILNPTDKQLRQFFLQQLEKKYKKALEIASKIPASGTLNQLRANKTYANYDLFLGILNSTNKLVWSDPFSYKIVDNLSLKSVNFSIEKQKQIMKKTTDFLYTKECRWRFLLKAFGFGKNDNFRCGNCDNCKG